MQTHLIIGGCGFLGRHVARLLARAGCRVRIVDLAPFPASLQEAGLRDCRVLDLGGATPEEFEDVLGDADVVHHYAWSTIPQTANADPLADLRDNLGILIGLLNALRRRGSGRIVFTSSGGTVYGPLSIVPAPEEHPLNPVTAYGVSKVAAEKYLNMYRALYGLDARVARLSNPYGAGQNPKRPQGAVTHFVHRALAGEPIEIWGSGEVVRDFIHVADAAAGLAALSRAEFDAGQALPVFNIGSGVGASLNEIVAAIEHRLGRTVDVRRGAARSFDLPINILDVRRAFEAFGWRPRLSLNEGIAQMIADLDSDRERLFSSLQESAVPDACS